MKEIGFSLRTVCESIITPAHHASHFQPSVEKLVKTFFPNFHSPTPIPTYDAILSTPFHPSAVFGDIQAFTSESVPTSKSHFIPPFLSYRSGFAAPLLSTTVRFLAAISSGVISMITLPGRLTDD